MIKGSAKRKYDLPDFEALLKDAKNGSEPALLKFLQCFEGLAVKAVPSKCLYRQTGRRCPANS